MSLRLLPPVILLSIIFGLMIYGVLLLCDGQFFYTLDDPYIHLALSEQIASGHYGINPDAAAAPSSSILYPFLLAPFAGFSWHASVPLVIAFAATLGSVLLLYRFCLSFVAQPTAPIIGRACGLVLAIALLFNLVGVAFSGMEHSLHILFSLLAMVGALRMLQDRIPPRWLPFVLILLPLIRYEGLALALLTIALLAAFRPALATLTLSAMAAPLLAFSLFLHQHGLGWLPSSVMAKSPVTAHNYQVALERISERLSNLAWSFLSHMISFPGLLQILLCLLLALPLWREWSRSARSSRRALLTTPAFGITVLAIGSCVAQMLLGRIDNFPRYETYVVAMLIFSLLWVYRDAVKQWLEAGRFSRPWQFGSLGMIMIVLSKWYILLLAVTPLAAQEIYHQQYQLHRFVTDYYRQPVLVNDLGWVSYRNPYYVLDGWGLGNEEARRLRMTQDREGYWQLIRRKNREQHVALTMVYQGWLGDKLPPEWRPVAKLQLAKSNCYVLFECAVIFYAAENADTEALLLALEQFSHVLPTGTKLKIFYDAFPALTS